MKNSKALFQDFLRQLTMEENPEEIQAIGYLVFEKVLGADRTVMMTGKELLISPDHLRQLDEIAQRLNTHEPVQYILGEADFYGRKFQVDKSVLIPRPETELLVQEVLKTCASLQKGTPLYLLDIGTGSGCIPITIALENPGAEVWGIDVSVEAIHVAKKNAAMHRAVVQFSLCDILTQEIPLEAVDIIVSNPPYITHQEQGSMLKNVVDFEPHVALFVPDSDPLLFYKSIASKAIKVLRSGGSLLFEINEQFGKEVASLLEHHSFREVGIIKDLSGKDRIVKGLK